MVSQVRKAILIGKGELRKVYWASGWKDNFYGGSSDKNGHCTGNQERSDCHTGRFYGHEHKTVYMCMHKGCHFDFLAQDEIFKLAFHKLPAGSKWYSPWNLSQQVTWAIYYASWGLLRVTFMNELTYLNIFLKQSHAAHKAYIDHIVNVNCSSRLLLLNMPVSFPFFIYPYWKICTVFL